MRFPHVAFGTPRKLPKADRLPGRVVVLDIAFAAEAGGASFHKVTLPFIKGLDERLAMWVDHHDHELHAQYNQDPRFVLCSKAEHGACPEMITPALVEQAGPIDTICCHLDFDGLCAAAKWIREGIEPYAGADDDARAIDTRMGKASELGEVLDRALRAKARDEQLKHLLVRFLVDGATDQAQRAEFQRIAAELEPLEEQAKQLAKKYQVRSSVAVVDVAKESSRAYDKTLLLLLGQQLATVSVVVERDNVTAAAAFDSGIDLVKLMGLSGGMPTRISVARSQLDRLLNLLYNCKTEL